MARTKSPRTNTRTRTAPKAQTLEQLLIANSTQRIAEVVRAIAHVEMTVAQLTNLQRAVQSLEAVLKPAAPSRRSNKAAAVAATAAANAAVSQ